MPRENKLPAPYSGILCTAAGETEGHPSHYGCDGWTCARSQDAPHRPRVKRFRIRRAIKNPPRGSWEGR